MIVSKDTVVTLDYELYDSEGNFIERSQAPMTYLHGGYAAMFPLVEEALDGREEGDEISVVLEPSEAFGEYDEDQLRAEPRTAFPAEVSVGMQFEGTLEGSGETRVFTVTSVSQDAVEVDGNHPLAGRTLDFRCKVVGVRPATAEELDHGHVHGPGGHHHH